MTKSRKRILVVFPKEWDREAFARGSYEDYEFVEAGFDLFRFPSNARLMTFDARAFIDELVERWRGRIDGVFSNNEYFGALIAAAVAERLGLPGTPPAVVVTVQHKYYARLEQRLIAEEPVEGMEVNVDGYVREGRVTFLGLSDAVMFPGTDAFERFVYPSHVPPAVQKRMRELAELLLTRMGYRHGFFNIELFWNPCTDRIVIIEVNPRLASQLAGLYQRVDGIDSHRILLDLCTGAELDTRRTLTGCAIAASLVSRRFDGRPLAREPREADVASVKARYPDAAIMLYLKRGQALAREMKWLGSYRYAVINMGAASEDQLNRRHAGILNLLHLTGESPSS
ncbi:MAG: ATP-grasp domain-containing protein [Proteobacteria bacterium]|nr:ATP-grasp domain-containing protein [Pseudomonadota bacterium]